MSQVVEGKAAFGIPAVRGFRPRAVDLLAYANISYRLSLVKKRAGLLSFDNNLLNIVSGSESR